MPKDRKSQPHQKRRSRQYKAVDWTTGRAKARFPFSAFRNVKLFYIIGALIMIGSVGTGAMFSRRGTSNNSSQNFVTPEATAQATAEATPDGTPGPEETPTSRYAGAPAMSLDPNKAYSAVIHTDKGDVQVQLFAKEAPQTVNNFVFLARDGFYNGLTFYWVKPGFTAQTGDPENTGRGGPGYTIPDEQSGQPFDAGTVGMVKNRDLPNSAGSQFFITYTDQPQLSDEFTAFGRVVGGLDVLNALTPREPVAGQDLPPGDKILSIEIQES